MDLHFLRRVFEFLADFVKKLSLRFVCRVRVKSVRPTLQQKIFIRINVDYTSLAFISHLRVLLELLAHASEVILNFAELNILTFKKLLVAIPLVRLSRLIFKTIIKCIDRWFVLIHIAGLKIGRDLEIELLCLLIKLSEILLVHFIN